MTGINHRGRTKSPCHGCDDRSVGCHGECEKYEEYKKTHIAEVRQISRNKHEANITYRKHRNGFTPSSSEENRVFKNHKK